MKQHILKHRLTERSSLLLDLLRGSSAILVMAGHLRGLFFVPFSNVENPTLLIKALYFLTSLGHASVIVFFVLSGYFVAGSVMRGLAEGTWRWRSYAVRRLCRLYLVLLPALALGWIVDLEGLRYFGVAGIYAADQNYSHIISWVVQDRLNVQTFAANALFLQEILAPTFGSNGPLWSLSYEFWFYVMFPCAALFFVAPSVWARGAFALAFIAISIFVGPVIFCYFFIWLLGAAIAIAPMPKRTPWLCYASLAASIMGCFLWLALRTRVSLPSFYFDLIFAVAVSGLIHSLANWPSQKSAAEEPAKSYSRVIRVMAGFSYTLYLVHLPVLVLLTAAWIPNGAERWQPDFVHGAVGLCIGMAVILYALLLSRMTEAHTGKVGDYLIGRRYSKLRRI